MNREHDAARFAPKTLARTCLLVLLGLESLLAQDSFTPRTVAPGATTEIAIALGSAVHDTWTSFPAAVSNGTGAIRISVAPGTPVGIHAFRVATSNGLSPLHLIMIDDLPTLAENGSNTTRAAAQKITPPVAIDGRCDEVAFDFYRFSARKGQALSLETVAQRLGFQTDTVLRVLDENGRELLFNDDAAAGRDSRCSFKAPHTGEYFLELRDMNYAGGPAYGYRLRIGDFPLVSAVFPPAISRGEKAHIQWLGTALESRGVSPGAVSVRTKGHSGFGTVLAADMPEAIESEPNDASPDDIAVPGAVSGRFEKKGDRDLYRFKAHSGQRVAFAAATRTLNSPCDALMRLLKSDGSQLAEANVDDAALTNTFKDAGSYLLEVRELTGDGASDFVYRIEAQSLDPGFVLAAETNQFEFKDGALALKVTCARRDYPREITLNLVNHADWFVLEGQVIESGKNETALKLKPTEQCPRRKILTLEIAATARISGKDVAVRLARKAPIPDLERLLFGYVP